jgi:hypothetical protein
MPPVRWALTCSLSISGGPSGGEEGSLTGSLASTRNCSSAPAGVSINRILPFCIPVYLVGEGTVFEDVGFVVGTVLGLLVLTAGSSLLGVTLLRERVGSRLGAWLLVLSLPGILLANFLGFGNIPSGPVLWYGLIWVCWDIRCGR